MKRKVFLQNALTESLNAENRFAGVKRKWPPSGIPSVFKHKAIMGAPITVLEYQKFSSRT